jgi:hypothetical protein
VKIAKKKLRDYFFFNGFIRILMETAFELYLAAVLNMHTADWDTPFYAVRYSNALSLISLIVLGVIPPLLTTVYLKNFSKLKQKNFSDKYGAGFEGTKVDVQRPQKSILACPLIFFGRRILFAVSAVYL